MYLPLEITLGIPILLCEKEGWEIATSPGLSEVELSYHKEPISASIDLGDHAHALKGNLVH
jgi:hypothetical protein